MKISLILVFGMLCMSLVHAIEVNQEFIKVAKGGDIQKVQELINARVDINVKDHTGCNALLAAAREGHKDVVELLLKHNADINAQDNNFGHTALMVAASGDYKDIVELLLKYSADINTLSKTGKTALFDAVYRGSIHIVKLLLNAGADVTVTSETGRTALTMAKDRAAAYKIFLHQKTEEEYQAIGRTLLDALIQQKRLAGAQRAGKRALLKQLEEHQHIPDGHKVPKEIIAMIFREIGTSC